MILVFFLTLMVALLLGTWVAFLLLERHQFRQQVRKDVTAELLNTVTSEQLTALKVEFERRVGALNAGLVSETGALFEGLTLPITFLIREGVLLDDIRLEAERANLSLRYRLYSAIRVAAALSNRFVQFSIAEGAVATGLSNTTVEAALDTLVEIGYCKRGASSGYYKKV